MGKKRLSAKYGLIDKSGKIIFKPDFCVLGKFKNGLAKFGTDDPYTCGFIDKSGKILIQSNKFYIFQDFSDGLAAFKLNRNIYLSYIDHNDWGYIDLTCKVVIEPRFAEAEPFKNGYARVKVKNWFGVEKWRTIDKTGKFID